MNTGEKLKCLRVKHRLTQEEVAQKLNTTKQAIYKYENSVVTNIPIDKIEMLASMYNVTPAYLIGWEEQKNNPSESAPEGLDKYDSEILTLFYALPENKKQQAVSYLEFLRQQDSEDK